MNAINLSLSRRRLLQGAGALVVSAAGVVPVEALAQAAAKAVKPALHPTELDSWVAIGPRGDVTAFFGKMDMGQGVDVAIAQIVAEELDVPFAKVTVVMGDSARTLNQGGASGSTGIQLGAQPLRNAAAEARRLLLEMGAKKLGVAADKVQVADGVVSVIGAPTKRVTYGELVGRGYFNSKVTWNNQVGNGMNVTGQAKPKSPNQYKIVGTSPARFDVPGKVYGTKPFVTDIKVKGMVHGRIVRPPQAGATPVSVDEASLKGIPGARVVRKGDWIGVVAPREWDAIRASEALKVTWTSPQPAFPEQKSLYDHLRTAPVDRQQMETNTGDAAAAFAGAAKVLEAEYEFPFQSHASMGPACAVADVRADGVTLWTGSQKPHFAGDGVAKLLGLPSEKVHAIWVPGPGSYGRNDAGDVAHDAALMSQIVGKPVRVQYMRHEGHGWDPKAPPSVHKVRAALDAQGQVIGYEFMTKGLSRTDMSPSEANPADTIAGHLTGTAPNTVPAFGVPQESYAFAAKKMGWDIVKPFLAKASPLRTSHMRDPVGPQICFASESFMDEIAQAVGADPIEFRLRYVKDPRDIAVLKAAADKAGWKTGPIGTRKGGSGDIATGRGVAYGQRGGTRVAVVADVDVNKKTGEVWARRITVAHDCGLIINPEGLKLTIEGNVMQSLSRMLHEEVTFDRDKVTSVDWLSYPIAEISDAPEQVDIVLINRPELPPSGAGEGATRMIGPAVANAIFEATGQRIRRAPLTPDRVKATIGAQT